MKVAGDLLEVIESVLRHLCWVCSLRRSLDSACILWISALGFKTAKHRLT